MQTKNIKRYLWEIYNDRLGVTDLKPIVEQACRDYLLGNVEHFTLNEYGFQDVNVEVVTSTGRYFIKFFSRDKTETMATSYVRLMEAVSKSKVSYPALHKGPQGYLHTITIHQIQIRLCVQHYIDGKNLHKTGVEPTLNELCAISKEAALLNSIDFVPDFFELDTWATLKFSEMFPIKKEALTKDELLLVEPILDDYSRISVTSLPLCLVHGDIIRTNIMKDTNGKIWIIDLGAANYQARAVELAVMAHDLFLDLSSVQKTKNLRKLMLDEYQKIIKLKPIEIEVLPTLIRVTHAMYFLSAAFMERILGQGNSEISFWLNQSKQALKSIEISRELDRY